MHGKNLWITGLSAATVAVVFAAGLFACGGGDSSNGSGTSCNTDSDCTTAGEICHPYSKICVTKCNSDSECPNDTPHCSSAGVCQCATDAECGASGGGADSGTGVAGKICGDQSKLCEAPCTSTSCGQGLQCNASTGRCETTQTPTTVQCGSDGSCSTGICNYETGNCETAKTCGTTGDQPDGCSYGQACETSNTCNVVPRPDGSCPNFGGSGPALTWVPGSIQGPVIYAIGPTTVTHNAAFCGSGTNTRFKVHVYAYDPNAGFPTSDGNDSSGAQGADEMAMESLITYVTPAGQAVSHPTSFVQNLNTTNSNQNTDFDVNFCTGSDTDTSYSVGLFIDTAGKHGNEFCQTVQ